MANDYNGYKINQTLHKALQDEESGYAKYVLFGDKAKAEGFEELANSFYETAGDELAHARVWMNELGLMGDTTANLVAAIDDESNDIKSYYNAAHLADVEGFDELNKKFLDTAEVEKRHREKYIEYLDSLNNGTTFYSGNPDSVWMCTNCGYSMRDEAAPKGCPLCSYPQGYFMNSSNG